ncbi:uncharacterized protein LOC120318647 isoform X2 [Crotalus tigris]|uniref:uncharacterized protein LOC120318647 isoform X2 n=1 Tax=Crotalus tigris TaxID=88082 RepID=UPI00192F8574|nr:uncharacterized protein LOC120318647 isoform X2 [Crotalus tigris]
MVVPVRGLFLGYCRSPGRWGGAADREGESATCALQASGKPGWRTLVRPPPSSPTACRSDRRRAPGPHKPSRPASSAPPLNGAGSALMEKSGRSDCWPSDGFYCKSGLFPKEAEEERTRGLWSEGTMRLSAGPEEEKRLLVAVTACSRGKKKQGLFKEKVEQSGSEKGKEAASRKYEIIMRNKEDTIVRRARINMHYSRKKHGGSE